MSLLNSMGSQPTIRLLLLESLPTTEDLKYLIVTGSKSHKPVQLPFKREREAPTFVITYTHPNRWSFDKGDGISAQTIWTKESTDVMVIQNKIKGDSAVYSNSGQGQNDDPGSSYGSVPSFATPSVQDSLQRIFPNRQPQQGRFSTTDTGNSSPVPANFGDWGAENQASGGATEQTTSSKVKTQAEDASTTSTGEFAPTSLFESWMPEDRAAQLPPPIELDHDASAAVADLLRDSTTGLMSFQGFTFFLIRELIRQEVSGANLAVIGFDFVDTATNQAIELSKEETDGIATHLNSVCSTLHVASRMDSGEFIVLLCDSKAQDAKAFAEMLRENFGADDSLVYLCAGRALAFGIATAPDTCSDAGTLIAAALQIKDTARATSNHYMSF